MQPRGSWKKPNSFIQVLFYTSSITLENSLWHQQLTEVLNKLRSVSKVEIRKEGISQQVFEKVYHKRTPLHLQKYVIYELTCISGIHQAVWLLQWDFVFWMYSLYLDIVLCLGKWNWSTLKKISFLFSVVPDSDTTKELYLEKNLSLGGGIIFARTYVLYWCIF